MPLAVGDQAPDFALKDQHGQTVRLVGPARAQGGARRLLPLGVLAASAAASCTRCRPTWTTWCPTTSSCVTVSTDSMYALRSFADQEGFTFPMLSDFWPHGAVARAYGVLHEEIGIALRGTFLVDRDGVVRWSVLNGIPDARDIEDYKRAIAAL